MRLSENFTLKELTKTSSGIPNLITDLEIERLVVALSKGIATVT